MNDFLKEALSHDWIMKYITEFIGTALMVALGNGSVANVEQSSNLERLPMRTSQMQQVQV